MSEIAQPTIAASHAVNRLNRWDICGVFVLPPVCFVADVVFGGLVVISFPLTIWTLALAAMGAFLWARRLQPVGKAAPVAGGMLIGAGLSALLIGTILLPLSISAFAFSIITIAFAFAGLGLLGLVPFLTGWRLLARGQRLLRGTSGARIALIPLGMSALAIPALIAFSIEQFGQGMQEADLVSGDRERILRVLSGTRIYTVADLLDVTPVMGGTPLQNATCAHLDDIPVDDPAINEAIRDLLGADRRTPADACALLID